TAFVHTKVRLEHFRRMHFFVAQLRFAENLRLQLKLHEFLQAFSLDEHLWSFLVNRHAQFVLLSEKNRPFLRRELEAEFFEQSPQFCHLIVSERMCIRIHSQKPFNAERSTSNAQLRIRRWTFDVGRWTLDVTCQIVTSLKNISPFRRSLLRWFRRHGRNLPWRKIRDPYAILVSEFMLQQTQVATVIPYYNKWLRRFPDFASVSCASQNDVLHAWQGLGYYNRARNLRDAASIVQDRHRGTLPGDVAAIRKLPGVGRYIANAVATFAFNQPVPIVEANSSRVLARLLDMRASVDSAIGREKLWAFASQLVPKRNAARFNSALIDLGALVCLPDKPKCNVCPVKKFCRAKNPESLPIKKSIPRTKRLIERHALVVSNGRVLLEQSSAR